MSLIEKSFQEIYSLLTSCFMWIFDVCSSECLYSKDMAARRKKNIHRVKVPITADTPFTADSCKNDKLYIFQCEKHLKPIVLITGYIKNN